jgi:hypothetical protein
LTQLGGSASNARNALPDETKREKLSRPESSMFDSPTSGTSPPHGPCVEIYLVSYRNNVSVDGHRPRSWYSVIMHSAPCVKHDLHGGKAHKLWDHSDRWMEDWTVWFFVSALHTRGQLRGCGLGQTTTCSLGCTWKSLCGVVECGDELLHCV